VRDADDGPYAQVVAEARVVKAKMTVARTVDKVGRLQSASDRNNTALYMKRRARRPILFTDFLTE
jgi:hypothetical protein